MKRPINQRAGVIKSLIADEINIQKATEILGCSRRTVERYRRDYLAEGESGLVDHRHSNYHKLTKQDKQRIVDLKKNDRWRSARSIRDKLELPVNEATVWRVLDGEGLTRENIKRVKPTKRFEANHPNDLWQADIMGKITFPNLGDCYLIAALDDHSRFGLAGKWYLTQRAINVFQVWYEALTRWGLPKAMLQDKGGQYKGKKNKQGQLSKTDYQWYAECLRIKLIWAKRAQTKGKIERFWRFVQDDFVREVWHARTVEEVNGAFKIWLAKYNYKFRSRYFGNITRASRYQPSERKVSKVELETLLIIEECRKVSRESTISLYGHRYYIPPGYIGCRIWVKIIGNKILFEAMGEIFHKTELKVS